MIEFNVKSCSECFCCDRNDFCEGYSCKLFEKLDPDHKYSPAIKHNKDYYETTPDWCPLRKQYIIISYESFK